MRSLIALCLMLALSASISNAFDCNYVQADDATVYAVCSFIDANTSFSNWKISDITPSATFNVSLGNSTTSCNGTTNVLATYNRNSTLQGCTDMTYGEPVVTLYNEDDPAAGLVFTYNTTATNSKYTVIANLICNEDAGVQSTFTNGTKSLSNNTFTVSVESSNSCPNKTLSKLSYFFNKYRAVFVTLFILLGLFVCFTGLNMLKYTIFIIGAVGGTLITASLFLSLVNFDTHGWAYWLIFIVCVIIGCVVGWIAVKIETLGFVVLGAVLGVVTGTLLFTAVIAPAGGTTVVYWITLVVCGIVGAGLAYKFWKSFVIIATGILGAFMVVKALGGIFGGFPGADTLAKGFHPTGIVYAYLAGIVVLAIAGIYVQHKNKKKTEEQEDADVHGYQRVMAGYNA